MRKLKLYNYNKSSFIDFNDKKYLVTDISGLGTKYDLIKFEKTVHDLEYNFENISLTINFGIDSNAYNDYKRFLDFIISNGKNRFILGYDYGTNERFADVYLLNSPKTQKTNYRIITETVIFERITPWYKNVEINSPGDNLPYELVIQNNTFIPMPVNVETAKDSGILDLRINYAGEFNSNFLPKSEAPFYIEGNPTTVVDGQFVISKPKQIISKSNNLFDKNNAINGKFYDGIENTFANSFYNFVSVKPNTSYTLKFLHTYPSTLRPMLVELKNDKTLSVNHYGGTTYASGEIHSVTITTNANTYFIAISVLDIPVVSKDLVQIQLNEGTEALPYQPYQEHIIPLTTPFSYGMPKLPNLVGDRWYWDRHVKNVGYVVLNGTEEWVLASTYTNTIRFTHNKSDVKVAGIIISTFFNEGVAGTDIENIDTHGTITTIQITISKSKLTTLDVAGFKTWLGTNNVNALYELATPETITTASYSNNIQTYSKGTVIVENGQLYAQKEFDFSFKNLGLQIGDPLTISFFACLTEGNNLGNSINIGLYSNIGLIKNSLSQVFKLKSEWAKYEYTFILTEEMISNTAKIIVKNDNTVGTNTDIVRFISKQIKIESGAIGTTWSSTIEEMGDLTEVGRVNATLKTGYSLLIDSENKQTKFLNTAGEISAYDAIDHLYDSFINLDKGLYVLKDANGFPLKITYKKWVAD